MISRRDQSCCERARGYYFDYLDSFTRRTIPPHVLTHLTTCGHCQEQVHRLGEAVSEGGSSEATDLQGRRDAAMVDLLCHHFAYADASVACSEAKPFLPSLADPELEIRIPTPITAHVDRCAQCSEDVTALRSYHLCAGQLHRLSRLLSEGDGSAGQVCRQVVAQASSVAALRFEGVSSQVLSHLCACPACRDRIFELRAQLIEELEADGHGRPACPGVPVVDLLDYVLPYGMDFSSDPNGKFRQSLCEHARGCPTCLGTLQRLHRQIFDMAGRPNSDVATCYSIPIATATQHGEGGELSLQGQCEDESAEGPVSPAMDRRPVPSVQHAGLRIMTGRRAKAVAAAILLVTIGLATLVPAARAVSLVDVFRAVGRARNLHVEAFVPGDTRPVQEYWASKDLQQYLYRRLGSVTRWDLAGRSTSTCDPVSGLVQTRPMSEGEWAGANQRLATAFGMLPFDSPLSVPAGAEWARIVAGQDRRDGREIRELRWTETDQGQETRRIWRVVVDHLTGMPQRAEYYVQGDGATEYSLETTLTVEVLSRSQMQAVLSALSLR